MCLVKGTRLRTVEAVVLERGGAAGDRAFFVVDERGRMVNGKSLGTLQQVVAGWDGEELVLTAPGGERVGAVPELGEPLSTRFFSRPRPAREVLGPFSAALSRVAGRPLRLVKAQSSAVDRGAGGAASLVSGASLRRLAAEGEQSDLDARRFRMLIEIEGVEAHAEDRWVGHRAQVGEAVVRFRGHVGRCLITNRDPDSGELDLPVLDLLRSYRAAAASTEPLPLGIYGEVLTPGAVRVGDAVSLVE